MNGKDVESPGETPLSHSRHSGRNLRRVECCEHPTITAKRDNSIQETAFLMEAVLERGNMMAAYARVVSNKGAPGVDHMTTVDLKVYLQKHWQQLRDELISERYQPQPVKQVEIPKPDGGVRKLGIPTVVDRLIQQGTETPSQRVDKLLQTNRSEAPPRSSGFMDKKKAPQAHLGSDEEAAEEGVNDDQKRSRKGKCMADG